MITVRTESGKEQPYQIRPRMQEKLGNLRPGEKLILLIDDENHVIDIAAPEAIKAKERRLPAFGEPAAGRH